MTREAIEAKARHYLGEGRLVVTGVIGDHVTATVRISDLIEHRKRAIFSCTCSVGRKIVVEGEAVIQIPSRAPK